ncbi:MAG: Branched chain amino acid ABC transporter [Candidatus Magasanikbacteria bacterium GW2011_GWA2_56_11]|uniref:Branched chain amino acid ABC transporter n=1 Tax=Candidatus Magasanikbacteria bacterium GW2011_GWA2_56_11 TaxID=1619044 RepID=A0A0G1YHI5_9BACT|nr:MAG: Branched chain amino acid ABC transporter [Candidatus Magasanikbacteria bacterium GW2011_GWA2_56_11]
MKKRLFFIPAAVAAILMLVGAGCGNSSGENTAAGKTAGPIKIGFVGPMTGDAASYGENMQAALNIAVSEVNSAGGINGRRLEIITEDGQCDTKTALNAGNKLILTDNTPVILTLCSTESLGVAPVAENNKKVLLSPASTNPKLTDAGDYVFRLIASDSFQGKYVAEYVYQKLNKKKVAILFNNDSEWSAGVKDVFRKTFTDLGGEIVAEQGVKADGRDYRTEILKIKDADPELVYFPGMVNSGMVGLKQLKELGVTAPILGGDVWEDPKIAASLGSLADGVKYTVIANRQLPQTFVDDMNKTPQGQNVNAYSPRGYDAVKILAKIMQDAGDNPDKIKSGLYKLNGYQGIADSYTLDKNGDLATADYMIKEFRDGKIVVAEE